MTTRILDRIVTLLAVLAGVLLCLLVVLIGVDVFARSTRQFSLPFTLDVAEYTLYLMTFLAAPWVLRQQGHIAIEIFVERLPDPLQRFAARFVNAVAALTCSVLLVFSARQLWRSFESGNLVYESFVYPEWYQYAVPPPIFGLLGWQFLRRLREFPESDLTRERGI